MCGITILLRCRGIQNLSTPSIPTNLQPDIYHLCLKLFRRGPDRLRILTLPVSEDCEIVFIGSLLSLRGEPTPMPLVDEEGNILVLNGQIFGGVLSIGEHENDTRVLMRALATCNNPEEITKLLAAVEGPFALAFWSAKNKRLFYGRDHRCRRSLLRCRLSPGTLLLSSISTALIDVSSHPDQQQFVHSTSLSPYFSSFFPLNSQPSTTSISDGLRCVPVDGDSRMVDVFVDAQVLQDVVENPLVSEPVYWEEVEPTGLCSLTFNSSGECDWQLHEWSSVVGDSFVDKRVPFLGGDAFVADDSLMNQLASQFIEKLEASVRIRVQDLSALPPPEYPRVAILFSGGIDSLMLARLADRCLPVEEPIELINVAFEYYDIQKFASPDRITGFKAFCELRKLSPRPWRYICVNMPASEIARLRPHVMSLIAPVGNFMDVNIATALWCAASGRGVVLPPACETVEEMLTATSELPTSETLYVSRARIMLSGIGADEQLAGYTRHRRRFKYEQWAGLQEELDLEMGRIWQRNLGRDDRVIADHGKDPRQPFLDEHVVQFLRGLPLEHIVDMRQLHGIGDKKILRVAARILGLGESTKAKKQAIQFGSRISKSGDNPPTKSFSKSSDAATTLED